MNEIDKKFMEYHKRNPQIFNKIVDYAMQLKVVGRLNYGMKAIVERVRWDYAIKAEVDMNDFKINNNFTSRYARLAETLYPELKGFFEVRSLDSTSMFATESQIEMEM